jgi:hypothetical protein
VDKDARIITTATLIALAGGAMAFFMLTDRGRDALRHMGPALDDVSQSFEDVRTIVQKLERVVQEANAMVTDFRDAMPDRTRDQVRPHHVRDSLRTESASRESLWNRSHQAPSSRAPLGLQRRHPMTI